MNRADLAPGASLVRGLGPVEATALNVSNMVGIGPFITIPMFLASMQGPHAMIAWVVAAGIVLCDGLVWSELGAALPGSGGSYHFLREIFAPYDWGRLIPFLFIWQFLISGTLEIASGYIGAMQYAAYLWPTLADPITAGSSITWQPVVAALSALGITLLLARGIRDVGRLSIVLTIGTMLTVATIIVSGLIHFDARLFTLPVDITSGARPWSAGIGGALLIAIYDYLGYYNICHLGDEVRDPGRTIPRAVTTSVLVIASVYLTMNIAILGVVPWEEAMASTNIAATFIERLYGPRWAAVFTGLILWTSAACMFAITLGYSRIPFAAARNGDFFRVFARLDRRGAYPLVSLWALGALAAIFSFFPLDAVIQAAVTVRIGIQFIAQIVGLHLLRTTRPDVVMPYRMRWYPLPSLVALVGWLTLLGLNQQHLSAAAGVMLTGVVAFFTWTKLGRRLA